MTLIREEGEVEGVMILFVEEGCWAGGGGGWQHLTAPSVEAGMRMLTSTGAPAGRDY